MAAYIKKGTPDMYDQTPIGADGTRQARNMDFAPGMVFDDLAPGEEIGMIDPKRVCILGASYGGYAAMRAAQRDGGRFRCAISYAGVSDLGRMAGSTDM